MPIISKLLSKLNPKSVIERSPYFDEQWYREKYGIEKDAAKHYLNEGWLNNCNPSARFSTRDYLINNPDIHGINPLLHFELYGKNEGRRAYVPVSDDRNSYSAKQIGIDYDAYYKKIEEMKVVSFDVFDTLVIRPFVQADELFLYLEKEYDLPGFSQARKKAEQDCRKQLNKEVNIDEIYDFIDERYRKLKEEEIRLEISFCHENPLIRRVFDRARELNRRVIAVSDMYLPKAVVQEILKNAGYEMDEIYVSCDHGATKGSGELFRLVYKLEDCRPEEFVHFGDNYISDYSEAINSGSAAFQTPKIFDHVISKDAYRFLLSYYHRHDDLPSSIYLAQACEHAESGNDEEFFTKLGYLLGGPLAYAYLNFVSEKASELGVQKLLFVSRDGYSLKEIYEKHFYEKTGIPCAYAYLSRAAIFVGASENRLCNDASKILPIAKLYLPDLEVHETGEENEAELRKHRKQIDEWSFQQSGNLRKHLESISEGYGKLATVDMFSGNYTSQKGAAYYLQDSQITGFYAGNFADSAMKHESFAERLLGMRDNLPVKMSEFLISSFESPIIGVDEEGNAIYEYPAVQKQFERYEQIMKGMELYIRDFGRFFKENKEWLLSLEEWLDLSDAFLKECSDDDIEKLCEVIDSENPVSGSKDRTIAELIASYREFGY